MEQALLRTGLNGSALVGLLKQLALIDPPAAAPSFVEGMGRWLGWKEAIPLSAVLQQAVLGPAAALPAGRASHTVALANAETMAHELARVQAGLALAIHHEPQGSKGGMGGEGDEGGHDFLPFRHRCLTLQQAMATAVGPLRERLRAAVAQRSPAMARLAALDAVMAQALAPREQALLALLPVLLEKHFLRLRSTSPAAPHTPWLETFGHDMRRLLLAELDLRLQPSLGLLHTLQSAPQGLHE